MSPTATTLPAELSQPDDGYLTKAGDDDARLWSVTTLIGVLDKPALLYWAAEQTALAAIASAKSLPARVEEDGVETTVKWLRDARFRKPKDALSATALGTVAHRCFELWSLEGVRPTPAEVEQLVAMEGGAHFTKAGVKGEAATLAKMLDQFDRGWLQRFSPSYEATEVTVFNPDFGYAGTLDTIVSVDGRLLIGDYKTSRKSVDGQGKATGPYPEVALQLAAYRHAPLAAVWRPRRFEHFRRRYYLLGPEERAQAVPVPQVDGGICIHVTPEHCTAHPVRCDEEVFTHFLYVLECARWVHDIAPAVIGDPLEV